MENVVSLLVNYCFSNYLSKSDNFCGVIITMPTALNQPKFRIPTSLNHT